jgi:hypothetical protein
VVVAGRGRTASGRGHHGIDSAGDVRWRQHRENGENGAKIRACDHLTALVREHPGTEWLRQAQWEAYGALAICHWQAGDKALAEKVLAEQLRPPEGPPRDLWADQRQELYLLDTLTYIASLQWQAKHPHALVLAREAAALADRYADRPFRDAELSEGVAIRSLKVAAILNQLHQPAESLRQAEQSRRLFAGLRTSAPNVARHGQWLSTAWERIGKARWELGQADEALAGFRESAAVQRQVVEQAPQVPDHRMRLGRCYGRLAYWSGLRGDRAGAAAALVEREKACPRSANDLKDVSSGYRDLAEAVGTGRKALSPQEQAERQHYLAESERTGSIAATLAAGPTEGRK